MKIIFATNNSHKLDELRQIAATAGADIEILGMGDIGCTDDIPETGQTLEENAVLKASYIYEKYGIDCFADDTGLEVESLDGAPGVHSARYAPGQGHDAEANMRLLLDNMNGIDNRRARFRTVIALIQGGKQQLFEGIVNGEITTEPHGNGGFGYDPVFRPDGWTSTFGEASAEQKNAVSHRGRAVTKLMNYLTQHI